MDYNNISNITQFDKLFVYNPTQRYMLSYSNICDEKRSKKLLQFFNETGACDDKCDGDKFHTVNCKPITWRNGVCDMSCNNPSCNFDGGDCVQLCECWDEYELLGNGECDLKCNTSKCNYDELDCITLSDEQYVDECYRTFMNEQISECNSTWLNDGWCDSKCQHNIFCNFDGDDCGINSCDDGKGCNIGITVFDFVSNLIRNDNHIDIDEMCIVWPQLQSTSWSLPDLNCTNAILKYDLNDDQTLSYREAILIFTEYGYLPLTMDKALQLNCSICVGIDDYYD